MLAEHALQTFGRHCREFATSEFGQAVEVQQLALRKQHHERANGIVQQHRLHFAGWVQAGAFEHFVKADAQFLEQQPNNRRSVRGFGDEGSFCHGLYPFFLQVGQYNQLVRYARPEN
nr:hypothetical protein GCM10020185_35140 [Pseudomonas brassicacearum subsp. brassicacearum]